MNLLQGIILYLFSSAHCHHDQQYSVNCCHLQSISISTSDHSSPATNYQLAYGVSKMICKGSAPEARILTLFLSISLLSSSPSFLTGAAWGESGAVVLQSGCIAISGRAVNKVQMTRCLTLTPQRAAQLILHIFILQKLCCKSLVLTAFSHQPLIIPDNTYRVLITCLAAC